MGHIAAPTTDADAGDTTGAVLAKAAGGAGWVVGFRVVTRSLGLLSTLVLARILGPGDFGLVALAAGFTQTVDALVNFSVNEAIIRERTHDRALYDTAFTLSLLRGLVTAGVVAAVAYPGAEFFHEPRLAPVLLALAVSSLIAALENVRAADLARDFEFRREFQLWTVPRLLQVFGTIAVALAFRSYWALVFGILVGRSLRTALSYIMIPYRPRLSLSAWHRIFGFTAWSWVAYILVVVRDRVDTFLIGRLFSPAQVGVFALGAEIATLPHTELIDPISHACFPSFAELRRRGLGLGRAYVRLLGAASSIILPAGVGIAAVADPLVRLAFGPGWDEAIPTVQILGVSGALAVVGSLSGTLFNAAGLLRTSCAVAAVALLLRIVLLVALVPGGTLATVAQVIAVVAVLEQSAILLVTMRQFGVRPGELAAALGRTVVATAAMAAALVVSGLGFCTPSGAPLSALLIAIPAGVATYAFALAALWLLARRPDGPERDLLTTLARLTRRFVRRRRITAAS